MCLLHIKAKRKKVVWTCDASTLRNWTYLRDVSGEPREHVDSRDLIVEQLSEPDFEACSGIAFLATLLVMRKTWFFHSNLKHYHKAYSHSDGGPCYPFELSLNITDLLRWQDSEHQIRDHVQPEICSHCECISAAVEGNLAALVWSNTVHQGPVKNHANLLQPTSHNSWKQEQTS